MMRCPIFTLMAKLRGEGQNASLQYRTLEDSWDLEISAVHLFGKCSK